MRAREDCKRRSMLASARKLRKRWIMQRLSERKRSRKKLRLRQIFINWSRWQIKRAIKGRRRYETRRIA